MMRERSKPNENASQFRNFCPPLHFPKPFRGPVYCLCLVESGKQTQMSATNKNQRKAQIVSHDWFV